MVNGKLYITNVCLFENPLFALFRHTMCGRRDSKNVVHRDICFICTNYIGKNKQNTTKTIMKNVKSDRVFWLRRWHFEQCFEHHV